MEQLYLGADAAYPTAPLPPGALIVAGYVGLAGQPGQPDTPHIWLPGQWNRYLDPAADWYRPQCRALPIYTHNYRGDPAADARNAHLAATALGWDPDNGSRAMGWDEEFFQDDAYAVSLQHELNLLGWLLLGYQQTVMQFPQADFKWLFKWQPPGMPPPRALPPGADGLQFTGVAPWDHDLFSQDVYDLCGQGPRRMA